MLVVRPGTLSLAPSTRLVRMINSAPERISRLSRHYLIIVTRFVLFDATEQASLRSPNSQRTVLAWCEPCLYRMPTRQCQRTTSAGTTHTATPHSD